MKIKREKNPDGIIGSRSSLTMSTFCAIGRTPSLSGLTKNSTRLGKVVKSRSISSRFALKALA